MNRLQVIHDMEEMLGNPISMFSRMSESSLDLEWRLFKQVQFDEGPIPNKYLELMGLGISAVTKCRYCIFYHTEMAKLNGATDVEIESALHFAKSSIGWSTYISGLQMNFDEFREEVLNACSHIRASQVARV
jgi:AhpD family alkylhydroperoxidase